MRSIYSECFNNVNTRWIKKILGEQNKKSNGKSKQKQKKQNIRKHKERIKSTEIQTQQLPLKINFDQSAPSISSIQTIHFHCIILLYHQLYQQTNEKWAKKKRLQIRENIWEWTGTEAISKQDKWWDVIVMQYLCAKYVGERDRQKLHGNKFVLYFANVFQCIYYIKMKDLGRWQYQKFHSTIKHLLFTVCLFSLVFDSLLRSFFSLWF